MNKIQCNETKVLQYKRVQ